MTVLYLLELRNATKGEVGEYTWAFGNRNEVRPVSVTVGPCSVTTDTDQRQVTILSDSFRNAGKTHTLRGDNLQNVLTVIHPDERYTHNVSTAASGGSAPPASGSDESVEQISTLKLWIDMREDTLLSSAYANSPNIGDPVRYIYQNASAENNIFTGYADFDVSVFGNGRGISSQASWQYAVESASPNSLGSEDFTFIISMKLPVNTVSGNNRVVEFFFLKLEIRQGLFTIQDSTGNPIDTGVGSLIPTKDVMLTIQRRDDSGNGTYGMFSTMERLDTGTITTGPETASGKTPLTSSAFWLSKSNEHFLDKTGILGPLILFEGTDAAEITDAQAWVRAQYGGTGSGSSSRRVDHEFALPAVRPPHNNH